MLKFPPMALELCCAGSLSLAFFSSSLFLSTAVRLSFTEKV